MQHGQLSPQRSSKVSSVLTGVLTCMMISRCICNSTTILSEEKVILKDTIVLPRPVRPHVLHFNSSAAPASIRFFFFFTTGIVTVTMSLLIHTIKCSIRHPYRAPWPWSLRTTIPQRRPHPVRLSVQPPRLQAIDRLGFCRARPQSPARQCANRL